MSNKEHGIRQRGQGGRGPPWIFIHGIDIVEECFFSSFFLLFFGLFSVGPSPLEFFLPKPLITGVLYLLNSKCFATKWNCTFMPCQKYCAVVEASRFMTFDGREYSFSGTCQYILSTDSCNNTRNFTFTVSV